MFIYSVFLHDAEMEELLKQLLKTLLTKLCTCQEKSSWKKRYFNYKLILDVTLSEQAIQDKNWERTVLRLCKISMTWSNSTSVELGWATCPQQHESNCYLSKVVAESKLSITTLINLTQSRTLIITWFKNGSFPKLNFHRIQWALKTRHICSKKLAKKGQDGTARR